MPSYFWEGLAGPLEKQVEKGLDARRDRIKRSQQRDEAVQFIEGLKQAGIGVDQLSSVNPESGAIGMRQDLSSLFSLMGQVPGATPGSGMGNFVPERINKGGMTFYNPEAAKQRAAATAEGRGPSMAENTQIETMDSSLRSIGEIENLLKGDQGAVSNIIQATIPGIPGQTGLAFHIRNVADNLLRLKSGAQINEQEYRRLRSLLPEIWDGEGVSQIKLNEFKTVFQDVIGRQREKFGMGSQASGNQSGQQQGDIPQEIMDQLPPGAKVRRVR